MPPKGSTKKRADLPTDNAAASTEESNGNSLRRSTRGGGHAAPESKPAASKPKSASNKKAKVDKTDDAAPAEEKPAEDGSATDAANGDSKQEGGGEAAIEKENKEVAEEHKESKSGSSKRLEVGETLPAGLVLKNEKDEEVKVEELTKDKGAIFFVYPKANTPGCTTQACNFRDQYAEFGPLGYEVYGLSGDSPTSQANWKTKHSFPYSLLCDPGQILLSLLGAVKGPKSNQRSHYIVEKGGKIVDAKYTVSPKDSTRLALEFIKGQAGPDGEKKD